MQSSFCCSYTSSGMCTNGPFRSSAVSLYCTTAGTLPAPRASERNVASSTSPVGGSPCVFCHHQTLIAELRPQRPSSAPTEKWLRSRNTCVFSTEGPRTSPVIGTLTGAALIAFASRPLNVSFCPETNWMFGSDAAACCCCCCCCCAACAAACCCCCCCCAACCARNDCSWRQR